MTTPKNGRKIFLTLSLLLAISFAMGCASFGRKMKSLVSGEPEVAASPVKKAGYGTRYSETSDIPYEGESRQYRRMTRDRFEQENLGERNSGSLWVMEGQGSYLFSQNMMRVVGDVLAVRLDGEPKKQLETKVDVLKKLLIRSKPVARAPAAADAGKKEGAAEKPEAAGKEDGKDKKSGDGKDDKTKDQKAAAKQDEGDDDEKGETSFGVHSVPARIMERLPDGTYRVKGSQSFMIGKNEYKVIMVGVIRASDINDDAIDSSKVIDSRFDIVSQKKKESTP